jgi:hypothetical protein
VHVDDTLGGGTSEFHKLMDAVAMDLKVGLKETGSFHYKGLRVSMIPDDDGFKIVVDGDEYLKSAIPMVLPVGQQDDGVLNPLECTHFRSVAGCIGYMASSFRPDLSLEASLLGGSFAKPTVRDSRKSYSILQWAKANRFNMTFRGGATRLVSFSDSAGPNEDGIHGGVAVCSR